MDHNYSAIQASLDQWQGGLAMFVVFHKSIHNSSML